MYHSFFLQRLHIAMLRLLINGLVVSKSLFFLRTFVFHSIIVVNLLCSSFLLVKEKEESHLYSYFFIHQSSVSFSFQL